ncbi:MAG: LysM peptidoglycan-binding domain-containing protein [Oscillospiraceae bacterium]|nr:LysM peptidoglycan-binding domain-containing protein [Oscillospiraceae bacterium]
MKNHMKHKLFGALAALALSASTLYSALSAGEVRYTVKSGDSLWTISRLYATTADELRRLNNLASDSLLPGQVLVVSAPASNAEKLYVNYIVRRGDTLGKIAEAFGTQVEFIRSLNGVKNDMIYIGDSLKVPAEYFEHTVQDGDTLWKLALRYSSATARIKLFSGIDLDDLRVGQILKIPGQQSAPTTSAPPPAPTIPTKTYITYSVERGDTVWRVSVKFGIPMQELLSDNGLNTESVLSLGQPLKIARHHIPVVPTPGAKYGEYLDWWTQAQYVVPIDKVITIHDFDTGKTFKIKRTIGAGHADCEPLTAADTAAAKAVFGGFTWTPRAVIAEADGRRLAASMSFYPHDVSYIANNNFQGHHDLYFANCIRHADGLPDPNQQRLVEKAAGR